MINKKTISRKSCEVAVTGNGSERFLNELAEKNVSFWDCKKESEILITFHMFQFDFLLARNIALDLLCSIEVLKFNHKRIKLNVFYRPVLLFFCILSLLLVLLLPNYVLFYRVSGNVEVSDERILRLVSKCGAKFGTRCAGLDPQRIENRVLANEPDLQWITVTANGCLGEIKVRERIAAPEIIKDKGFSNVVAGRSGMITSQNVLSGTKMKNAGDIVYQGELLVSGVVDLEKTFLIEYARAEIYAKTWHQVEIVTPATAMKIDENQMVSRSIWLEFGNERIKIFGNSGIYTDSYDKIAKRKVLTLPGGFELPIALYVEVFRGSNLYECSRADSEVFAELEQLAVSSVEDSMQSGKILLSDLRLTQNADLYRLSGVLECHEMIARNVDAKWNEEDYQYD